MLGLNSNTARLECSIDGIDPTEVSRTIFEECVSAASRFQVFIPDPAAARYSEFADIAGNSAEITIDSQSPFKGKVWGRRLLFDSEQAGSVCVVYGYDDSFALKSDRKCRAFANADLETVVKSVVEKLKVEAQFPKPPGGRLAQPSTIVQYLESDFAFLYRLAYLAGMHLWPYRGELWFGHGPGAEETCEIDVSPNSGQSYTVEKFELADGFDLVSDGATFPVMPVSFEGAATPEDGDSLEVLANPSDAVSKLSGQQYYQMPAGIALTEGDVNSAAEARFAFEQRERIQGSIIFSGDPPKSLILGAKVQVQCNKATICEGATIMRLRHEQTASARRTHVFLGRQGNAFATIPNLYPAVHFWPAQVEGQFDSRIGTIPVKFAGWDQESEAVPARVLSLAAQKDLGVIPGYSQGEWVMVGFEQGNPDAPLIFGSIFTDTSPAVEKDVILKMLSKKDKLDFQVTSSGITLKAQDKMTMEVNWKDLKFTLKVGEQKLELDTSAITLTSKNISMKEK